MVISDFFRSGGVLEVSPAWSLYSGYCRKTARAYPSCPACAEIMMEHKGKGSLLGEKRSKSTLRSLLPCREMKGSYYIQCGEDSPTRPRAALGSRIPAE
ncbi:hypothetical protein Y1Q_0019023 [Alligator mississippiensis]|uniref:Uncharacterized protein n=1 Tax=Alligator mississippiensis TaxID=8496 RepID=A0A151M3Q4_ALLMI|nr:hypothetical protein Y1Q_0019023 [Alligator mississippiensis]